jgi:hypothetical protein
MKVFRPFLALAVLGTADAFDGTLTLDKMSYAIGEPIVASFTTTNKHGTPTHRCPLKKEEPFSHSTHPNNPTTRQQVRIG